MANNKPIEFLLSNLFNLEDGKYISGNSLEIDKKSKNEFQSNIFIKNIDKSLNINIDGFAYSVFTKLSKEAELFSRKDEFGRYFKSIHVDNGEKKYSVYKGYISSDDYSATLKNNILLMDINEHTSLGYDLSNSNVYVYYKKYNAKASEKDIDKDYVKMYYTKGIIEREVNNFNSKISSLITNLNNELSNVKFQELAKSIQIKPLESNLSHHYNKLLELVEVYTNYIDKFDILESDEYINDINELVKQVINEPIKPLVNGIKESVNNVDINDIASLKTLRNDIDQIIKFKSSRCKKKRLSK